MAGKKPWTGWHTLAYSVSALVGLLALLVVWVEIDRRWQMKRLKDSNPATRIEAITELSNVFCSDPDTFAALIDVVKDIKLTASDPWGSVVSQTAASSLED